MQDDRVETLIQIFSKTRRTEIDAAWPVAESMGDDLVVLLSEAFPQMKVAFSAAD